MPVMRSESVLVAMSMESLKAKIRKGKTKREAITGAAKVQEKRSINTLSLKTTPGTSSIGAF